MKLTLRLFDHETETGQTRSLELGRLTIGRGAENDWMLADPDRTLSKNHCRIDASEAGFMLTDMSTNGVFLAGAPHPIGRGQSCALEDGDSFAIGPYRLQAAITGQPAGLMQEGGLGLPQSEVDAIFLGGGGKAAPAPSPLAPGLPESWASELPSGGFGPGRRAAREGWQAPPDPASYAATGLFEQPASQGTQSLPDDPFAAPGAFSQQAEHIPAASTVMRLPEAQVVLPTDWNEGESDGGHPEAEAAWPPALPAEPAAPAWPPVLPEAPPPPPSLPADWVTAPPEPPAPPPPPLPIAEAPRPVRPPPAPRRAAPVAAAPRPVRPAPVPAAPTPVPTTAPAPSVPMAASAGADASGAALIRALLDGAGLPAETFEGLNPKEAMREVGRMVRAAVEGVRDIMSTRALVKSEFRVDQTVLRRSDNNAVKFAPDAQRCVAAMVGAAPPGFLPGSAAMKQSMDDIKLHELALVAALNSVFADLDQQLDPEVIARRARQDTGISSMLPYAREARCWAIYVENHKLLQDSGAPNTGGSLLAPLALAYARQLRRGN